MKEGGGGREGAMKMRFAIYKTLESEGSRNASREEPKSATVARSLAPVRGTEGAGSI